MPLVERKTSCDLLGLHRVMDPKPVVPQGAMRLDSSLPIFSNEILVSVDRLNIDAASFIQMEKSVGGSATKVGELVLSNTRQFGKQHNQVTGSGGMLIGEVKQIGKKHPNPLKLKVGERVASLVSLTLTPLFLEKVVKVATDTHQIDVVGHAIFFETGILARMPKNLPGSVAMAVFDVAGAPARVYSLCRRKQTVVVVGAGGKAGLLSCLAARKKMGREGRIIAVEPSEAVCQEIAATRLCDDVVCVDATDAIAVHSRVSALTRGKMANIVINVAPVPETEMASLLSVRKKGTVLFFGMATSFSRVALASEGIGLEAQLLFGNGYFPGHSDFALKLLSSSKAVSSIFLRRYNR